MTSHTPLTMSTTASLTTPLPSGGWTLYFHPTKETRWNFDTFRKIGTARTFKELGELFQGLSASEWTRGKFFFTPEAIPPLMENAKNIRGGSYSLRAARDIASSVYHKFVLAAVLEQCTANPDDKISCVRITPRRDFNIIQIWNRDCEKFNATSGILQVDERIPPTEIKYVPHVEKKI
jgi:hypothetical protein